MTHSYNQNTLSNFIFRGKTTKKTFPFVEERSSWSKLYPKCLLTPDCLFDESVQTYGEDVIFNWKIYYKANRLLCFDNTIMYFYREQPGSLVRRYVPNMELKFYNLINALEKTIQGREEYWQNQLSLDCFNIFFFNCLKFSIFSRNNQETSIGKYKRLINFTYKSILSKEMSNIKILDITSYQKRIIYILIKFHFKHVLFIILKLKYNKRNKE